MEERQMTILSSPEYLAMPVIFGSTRRTVTEVQPHAVHAASRLAGLLRTSGYVPSEITIRTFMRVDTLHTAIVVFLSFLFSL